MLSAVQCPLCGSDLGQFTRKYGCVGVQCVNPYCGLCFFYPPGTHIVPEMVLDSCSAYLAGWNPEELADS